LGSKTEKRGRITSKKRTGKYAKEGEVKGIENQENGRFKGGGGCEEKGQSPSRVKVKGRGSKAGGAGKRGWTSLTPH